MINLGLNVTKALREKVEPCMKTTFVAIAQPFNRFTFLEKKTRVLALIMFYGTKAENISNIVLSCVIYTIINNYACIDYLAFQ